VSITLKTGHVKNQNPVTNIYHIHSILLAKCLVDMSIIGSRLIEQTFRGMVEQVATTLIWDMR